MRRSMFVLVALAVLTASLVLAASASAGVFPSGLVTSLNGQEEVSDAGVPGQGDPDGRGFAVIRINTATDEICWTILVRGIELPATAAHIHQAPAGTNGPIVVTLSPPARLGGFLQHRGIGLSKGCTTSSSFADAVAANPSGFYVNVHNTPFPAGALRGQL